MFSNMIFCNGVNIRIEVRASLVMSVALTLALSQREREHEDLACEEIGNDSW
jgi:hypothetical protein